jgi:hypothetical protein
VILSYEVEGSLRGMSTRHLDRMVDAFGCYHALCAEFTPSRGAKCQHSVGRLLYVYAGEAKMNSWVSRMIRKTGPYCMVTLVLEYGCRLLYEK